MKTHLLNLLRFVLMLVFMLLASAVTRADAVFVWNTDGSIVKFDTNGVGTVFPTNLSGGNGPVGLTVDNSGNLYAGCPGNGGIWRFATNGTVSRDGTVDSVSALAFDSAETLYATIPNYNEAMGLQYHPGPGYGIFSGPSTLSHLCYPVSLAINRSGTIFVANASPPPGPFIANVYTNTIQQYSANLSYLGTLTTWLTTVWGLAFDKEGNLFVSGGDEDYYQEILKFATNGSVSVFADYDGSGLRTPKGLAFDSTGNLFVANSGNNRILKFSPAGQMTVFASNLVSPTSIAIYPGVKLWPVPIRLTNEMVLPGGEFQFSFATNPYGTNTVLATTNLPDGWTAIGTAVEVSPGDYQFTDSQATTNSQRLYRVRRE